MQMVSIAANTSPPAADEISHTHNLPLRSQPPVSSPMPLAEAYAMANTPLDLFLSTHQARFSPSP
eukprot:11321092-Prorocentrum_lima.AAC.1